MTDALRGSVRPLVTIGLIAAFILCALVFGATGNDSWLQAAGLVGNPSGILIGFWFKERSEKRA